MKMTYVRETSDVRGQHFWDEYTKSRKLSHVGKKDKKDIKLYKCLQMKIITI